MASFSNISSTHLFSHHHQTQTNFYTHSSLQTFTITTHHGIFTFFSSKLNHYSPPTHLLRSPVSATFSSGNSGGFSGNGGGGGGEGGGGEEEERDRNWEEAMVAMAEARRSLESFPADLAVAVKAGRVPGSIVRRFFELEESVVFRWLLKFGGFKERLLADDLFLSKLVMECVVVIFTKVYFHYYNYNFIHCVINVNVFFANSHVYILLKLC